MANAAREDAGGVRIFECGILPLKAGGKHFHCFPSGCLDRDFGVGAGPKTRPALLGHRLICESRHAADNTRPALVRTLR
jgi:hypothetical protein